MFKKLYILKNIIYEMKIINYNKFKFIEENFPAKLIKESTEFADMQLGQLSNPLGPGYGFATDPTMSVYSDDSSPYVDNYSRVSQMATDMGRIINDLRGSFSGSIGNKMDYFLEDIDDFKNIKILRVFINNNLKLDVFISYVFMDEEFFGVFRNFNGINKPKFDTDLLTDPRFRYIDKEYYIKLNNYFYKIIYNWFIPSPGDYKIMSDELKVKNSLGDNVILKKNSKIYLKGYNTDQDNDPFLIVKYKENIYKIIKNDYFFFKYWTDKVD